MAIFLIHAAVTWFMCGVIWIVQIVHYPLFVHVGADEYPAFHQRHMRLITWIVAPAMGIEAVTALLIAIFRPPGIASWLPYLGAGLVAAIWLSTAFVQVPAHRKLAARFDAALVRQLVLHNWLRTILWTLRGALVLWMLKSILS